jgi:hypothetical protein
MSLTTDRMRQEYIKALVGRHVVRRRRDSDIADMIEASLSGRLLQSEPEKSLPDVPLHKRGFGIMEEDAP